MNNTCVQTFITSRIKDLSIALRSDSWIYLKYKS